MQPRAATTPAAATIQATPTPQVKQAAPAHTAAPRSQGTSNDWGTIVNELNLTGMVKLLASNCSLAEKKNNRLQLHIATEHASFLNERSKTRLNEALNTYYGEPVQLSIDVCEQVADSPLQQNEAAAQQKQKAAYQAISEDSGMQDLMKTFDTNLSIDSVKPAE